MLRVIVTLLILINIPILAQTPMYYMPEETAPHEGTWLQWPHNELYGPFYRDDVESTWVAMTEALHTGEKVHIVVYDSTEYNHVISVLNNASIPLTNIDFFIMETDDVWVRDNGPMFVYDNNDDLHILDWGFNGWGNDAPYSKCDQVPNKIATETGLNVVDLSAMILEGGAIEHDGHGTMMATRSSVTHSSRNPGLTEPQIEDYLTTYMGIENFIWLDGEYGQEITDMHIDGVMKFANDSTIVTMTPADLQYWGLSQADIDTLFAAKNKSGIAYQMVIIPLTQNNVSNTFGNNLGYKGSYANYYIANDVVLVPFYGDPNDNVALNIIQNIYPNKTAVGINVQNIYEYGGMVHCITQQQPENINGTGINEPEIDIDFYGSPNPVSEECQFNVSLPNLAMVEIKLYNLNGQLIDTVHQSSLTAGEHTLPWNIENYASGTYIAGLSVNGELLSEYKIIIQ